MKRIAYTLVAAGAAALIPPARAKDSPPRLVLPDTETLVVADRPAFVFLPPRTKRAQPQPWIFYAPTLPAYPDESERWMHERFLAAGIAVAGVDVGEAYGSPKSHATFDALYRELIERRGFAPKPCLFGQLLRRLLSLGRVDRLCDHPREGWVAALGGC